MGCFQVRAGLFGLRTWSGMISGVMESRLMARVLPEMELIDRSTLWKTCTFSSILLASRNVFVGSDRDFLGKFLVTDGFPGGLFCSRM